MLTLLSDVADSLTRSCIFKINAWWIFVALNREIRRDRSAHDQLISILKSKTGFLVPTAGGLVVILL